MAKKQPSVAEICANLHAEKAWRLASALASHRADAEDYLQQALLILVAKEATLPRNIGWPYYAAIITNVARNEWRKRAVRRAGEFDEELYMETESSDPARESQRDELASHAKSALRALPAEQREAISLTHLSGLTHKEAAEVRGVPLATQKSHAQRGIAAIRERLQVTEAHTLGAIAAITFTTPNQGIQAATASWIASAQSISSVGAALGGGASAAASTITSIAGVTTMTKITIATIAAAVGIAVGAAATVIVQDDDPQPDFANHQGVLEEKEKPRGANDPSSVKMIDEKRHLSIVAGLEKERDDALSMYSALKDEIASSKESEGTSTVAAVNEEPANAATSAIEFEDAKDSAWLKSEGFKSFTKDYRGVHKAYADILVAGKQDRSVDDAVYAELNTAYQQVYRTYGQQFLILTGSLPTHSRNLVEATMNHPALITPLWSSWLEAAEHPLSDTQRGKLEGFAKTFDDQWKKVHAGYDDSTLSFQKIGDEWRLKSDYQTSFLAILTPKQHAVIVEPELDGQVEFTRFNTTEVLDLHFVFSYDHPRLLELLKTALAEKFRSPEGFMTKVHARLERFLREGEPLFGKSGKSGERNAKQVQEHINLQIALLKDLMEACADEAHRKRIQQCDQLFNPGVFRNN